MVSLSTDSPLSFSAEILSKIYNLLVPDIPLTLVCLSKSHYDSRIPSIYTNIKLNSSNADHFRHGIYCIKHSDDEVHDDDHESSVSWVKRKCQACSYTETLVLEDESCLMVLDSIVQTALKKPLKMNKDEMESQDTYKSTVIFPNLKRVVLFSPLVELYLSNPFSEDFFKERIISLKTCIGLNNKLHIDLDAEGMTREMFGGFMKIIRFNLDPKSLVLKIRPDLFPIQSLYAKQSLYTGINLYIETKNVEEENKLQREVRRTYALLSLHFPNQVTHPVHFHLKDQQLIDVINERLSAYGSNKDKWIKIVKWENEDDWMK